MFTNSNELQDAIGQGSLVVIPEDVSSQHLPAATYLPTVTPQCTVSGNSSHTSNLPLQISNKESETPAPYPINVPWHHANPLHSTVQLPTATITQNHP